MKDRNVRVLHLTDDMEAGGLQRIVVTLANGHAALSSSGVGVAAVSGGRMWAALDASVDQLHLPGDRSATGRVRNIAWLARAVRSGRWDVIHAHQRGVALLARLVSTGSRVAVVEHVHNVFAGSGVARRLSFRGHFLIACGSAVKRMLVDEFGRDEERVAVVLNAVPDIEPHLRAPVPSLGRPAVRIVGVGRLSEQKDPVRFVEIVAELRTLLPDVTGEWVGDGELLGAFQEAVARTAHPEAVVASGFSEDVVGKLNAADVLLMTSRWEGLPLVALEAMACGRGIVAPRVGSMGDVVESGVNGLLYDPDCTAGHLALQLSSAIRAGEVGRWGPRSRAMFEERVTVAAMIEGVRSVYDRATT